MDRFEIRKPSSKNNNKGITIPGKLVASCYNLEKIGKYGICETFKKPPYNWGFCAKSCEFFQNEDPAEKEPYEEATLRYFEDAPDGSCMTKGKNLY